MTTAYEKTWGNRTRSRSYRNDLTFEEKRYAFADMFAYDLEHACIADIACCHSCHEDFVAMWPGTESCDEGQLPHSSLKLDKFYEHSRGLFAFYTREEFGHFLAETACPRCGKPLGIEVWPYNFPFDVPPGFEDSVRELGQLSEHTPFLLLTHPFANKILGTVAEVASSLHPTRLDGTVCRARSVAGKVSKAISEFEAPPKDFVTEGRYNHAGQPALYLGSDIETCREELRHEACVVAKIGLDVTFKVLDLVDPRNSHKEHYDALAALIFSALMSAKQPDHGWHKSAYVFSRFVADCARQTGIQALKYPSTRIAGGSYNLVVLDTTFRLAKSATSISFHDYL